MFSSFLFFADNIDSLCTTNEQISSTFADSCWTGGNNDIILHYCDGGDDADSNGGIIKTTLEDVHQVIDEIPDEKLFSAEDNESPSNNLKGNITEKEIAETGNVRFLNRQLFRFF